MVAQPDRPAGRGQALKAPATKAWAEARGVPVLQPEKVRDGALAAALAALRPDAAGGDRLRPDPGARPAHPGAARRRQRPRLAPARAGAGPRPSSGRSPPATARPASPSCRWTRGSTPATCCWCGPCAIGAEETAEALAPRLAALGGEAIVEALPLLAAGRWCRCGRTRPQVTLAPILEKADGRLDFTPAGRRAGLPRCAASPPGRAPSPPSDGKGLKVHHAAPARGGRRRRRPARPGARTAPCGWPAAAAPRSRCSRSSRRGRSAWRPPTSSTGCGRRPGARRMTAPRSRAPSPSTCCCASRRAAPSPPARSTPRSRRPGRSPARGRRWPPS